MVNDRIGCSNNRLTVVDPNLVDGFNSSNNISVPLEDLNISVQLKTWKKGRTVLSANNGNGTSESSKTVRVNFIEGSEINGVKTLTTKYTDLTTNFEKGNNDETLGITNIDIDFNPSMAPMVNITFVDVRGSAIFQNEANLIDGTNKYSTFFQLPYPLYELTVKGYYGRAVKYCLHMTKFNSKFNSQTGNFEITANFIGYTYAMLSDMLIGILKAIPYTKIGSEIYDAINKKRVLSGVKEVLNLNQLMIKIDTINSALEKISATERDAAIVGSKDEKSELIASLTNEIVRLGTGIEDKNNTTTIANGDYKIILAVKNPSEYAALMTEYNQNITNILKRLKELQSDIIFDINKFKPIIYPKFIGSDFIPNLNIDSLTTKIGPNPTQKATN
jgi:hypothetical protein